jgi:hypothetical protein
MPVDKHSSLFCVSVRKRFKRQKTGEIFGAATFSQLAVSSTRQNYFLLGERAEMSEGMGAVRPDWAIFCQLGYFLK